MPILLSANTQLMRVASVAGGNQREQSSTAAMKLPPQPSPAIARAQTRVGPSAAARCMSAPATVRPPRTVTVSRAPKRSNQSPTGICAAVSATMKAPLARPSISGVRARSRTSSGAMTPVETRKNWLTMVMAASIAISAISARGMAGMQAAFHAAALLSRYYASLKAEL